MDRKGEKNGRAKLTEEQVKQIRKEYKRRSKIHRGNGTILAKKYGVTSSMIYYIVKNQSWRTS